MRTSVAICSLALAAAALTGCSTEADMRAEDPAVEDAAGSSDEPAPGDAAPEMPTAIPTPEGDVATQGLVTVLDDGDGPELCLGGVAESYPPQCGGPTITGWDWSQHEVHEEAAGVRWGDFHLTGTFDGDSFEVVHAIPAALYDTMSAPPEDDPLTTPCGPESAALVDETKTSPEAMDATLQAAAALPGHAMAWLDGDIINVAVTEDPTGAEATLRETWGGGLCVTEAAYTETEMQAIQGELNAVPGMLTGGMTQPDQIELNVVFDDGSIQQWADATYGEGVVEVTSALVPVEGGTAG